MLMPMSSRKGLPKSPSRTNSDTRPTMHARVLILWERGRGCLCGGGEAGVDGQRVRVSVRARDGERR